MLKDLSLWQKCKKSNLNYRVVLGRVLGGWSIEKALKTSSNPPLELNLEGIIVNLEKICTVKKLNYQGVLKLIYTDNLSVKQALESMKEQGNKAVYQTITKEKQGLAGECAKRGLNYSTVYQRLKFGWSMEEALSTPINSPKDYEVGGEKVKLKDYCIKNKLDYITVRNRVHQSKMSFEDAIDMTKGKFHTRYKLNGKVVSIKEECNKRGLSYQSVISSLRRGKTVKEVLILDPLKKQERLELKKRCEKEGLNYNTFIARVRNGMSIEEALNLKKKRN